MTPRKQGLLPPVAIMFTVSLLLVHPVPRRQHYSATANFSAIWGKTLMANLRPTHVAFGRAEMTGVVKNFFA